MVASVASSSCSTRTSSPSRWPGRMRRNGPRFRRPTLTTSPGRVSLRRFPDRRYLVAGAVFSSRVEREPLRLGLRFFGLILPVILGFAGLNGTGAYAASYACADCGVVSAAPGESMAGTGHHTVEALVSRPAPVLDHGRGDTGGAKRRIGSQGTRPGLTGAAAVEAQAQAASRARQVARTSLDF